MALVVLYTHTHLGPEGCAEGKGWVNHGVPLPGQRGIQETRPERASETATFLNLALPLTSCVNLEAYITSLSLSFLSRDNNSGCLTKLCNLMQK